ncbi:caspase, EACC1-associated type [Lyngbya aestuarii]|uniref:caspase, EACC1-associated type n=1 Tax=Lyngbya aestuarii TaxID=118322 RepID=UPI00403E302A
MAKFALLVGVSEYQPGLKPLASAVQDVLAMQRVLENSEMGGFDEVKILTNPATKELEIDIYDLFAERHSEDVVLFYFSGHGVKDEYRNLYLTTPETRKSATGVVVTPTAVAASYLQTQMNRSLCQREVIILDCCYSGAIAKGLTAKDEGEIDILAELGGQGRAILTSSTSVQSSFQQEKGLSIYTQYIVEGIETGAADLDSDGRISADELHRYATHKVQEASPAMNPQFYPVEEGYRIYLARSPQDDPKLKYRKAVEEVVSEDREDIDFITGEIDLVNRCYLDELQTKLDLSSEDAAVIEGEVMEPYRQRFEKLQRYGEAFKIVWQKRNSLSEKDKRKLRRFQEVLGLRDEDVSVIETSEVGLNRLYRFRAECQADVDQLSQILDKRVKKITILRDLRFPDVEMVEIEVDLSLKELRDVMRQIVDSHVMVQRVAQTHK